MTIIDGNHRHKHDGSLFEYHEDESYEDTRIFKIHEE
jgi:hypothetical protein